MGAGVLLADPTEAVAARTPRVLAGAGRPRPQVGSVGDFYVDTRSGRIYGPKMRRSKKRRPWRHSVSLRGAPGAAGSPGAPGAPGAAGSAGSPGSAGYSVLHGSGPPAAELGRDGEFYVDTSTTQLYGPKAGGVWGSPASLTPAPAPSADWVPRVMRQTSAHEMVPLFQVEPYTAGSEPFQVQMRSYDNSPRGPGSINHGVWFGWNASRHAGEVGVVDDKPAIIMGFEDNYYDAGVERHTVEWYVEYWSPDGTGVQMFRPFYAQIAADTNHAHSAIITHDIGTDGDGTFIIYAGDGQNRELGDPFTIVHIYENRAEFEVDLHAKRHLLTPTIIGQDGAGGDLFIRPGSADGYVVVGSFDGLANLVTVDGGGNVTLNGGMTLQTYGAAGFTIAGEPTQPLGFFGAKPVARPDGVKPTAAGIHAALVRLGLIAG